MVLISFVIEKRKGNKICGELIIDKGNMGSNTTFEYTPTELLAKIDELDIKGNEILSNEPIILNLISFDDKSLYTKYRSAKVEEILDWWVE